MNKKRQNEHPKKKPPGKPFQPGDDPRRNKEGSRCKDAVAFGREFNKSLAGAGDPAALAALLWKRALAGHAWAVGLILDRLMGKQASVAIVPQGEPTVSRFVYADGTSVHPRPGFPHDKDKAGMFYLGPESKMKELGLVEVDVRAEQEAARQRLRIELSKKPGGENDPSKN